MVNGGDGDVPVPVGATMLVLITFPNTMVLVEAASGNAPGTALWRRITFWSDATMAAGAVALGGYALADTVFGIHEDNGWAGWRRRLS